MTTTERPNVPAALARSRENLIDTREVRGGAERLEFREDKSTGQIILQGYASTYDPYDVHGGPAAGGWVEQISTRAFDTTLDAQPDVQLLINHEGTPLARTKSGTLKLSRDRHGLKVWASLDPTDPDVQRLVPKMRRGDMDEMSFAFRVQDQTWDDSYGNRTITQLSLEKGDVSVVNYGMNPATRATVSDTVGALAQLSNNDLLELRKLSPDKIEAAAAKLAKAAKVIRSNKDDDPDARASADVKYADPGYKPDGKKRYPIDTKDHAKAAWSYINMPKNQKGYNAGQVSSIKSRIAAALKTFGVEVSDDDKKSGAIEPYDWQPGSESDDPHNAPYSTGTAPPAVAPTPANINPSADQKAAPAMSDNTATAGSDLLGVAKEIEPRGADMKEMDMTGRDMEEDSRDMDECGDDTETDSRDMDEECGDDTETDSRGKCPGGAACAGADCPEHGSGKMSRGYNPETGDIDASRSDDEDEDMEENEAPAAGDTLAAALDRTITHAYALAKDGADHADIKKVLATAQRQLSDMRGIKQGPDTDVSRKLTELREMAGTPDTGSVEEGFKYLRSAGSGAPVGYRGLLDHDPDLHLVTAAERLTMESIQKARRAAADAEDSETRLKRARREAELNRVIREKQEREARTGRIPASIND